MYGIKPDNSLMGVTCRFVRVSKALPGAPMGLPSQPKMDRIGVRGLKAAARNRPHGHLAGDDGVGQDEKFSCGVVGKHARSNAPPAECASVRVISTVWGFEKPRS